VSIVLTASGREHARGSKASEALPPELVGRARLETVPLPHDLAELSLLLVEITADPQPEIEQAAASWVGDHARSASGSAEEWPPSEPSTVRVPLYGTQVLWTPRRAAVLGEPHRLAAIRDALVDFATSEARLRWMEQAVSAALDDVAVDAPLATTLDETTLERAPELARRFVRAITIRTQLARLAPAVHRPPVHPPTLASQVGERLRERARLADRLEFVDRQAEVVDRVYELCSQRAGDLTIARRHMRLEWAIILLLAAELLVLSVELLAGRSS
jgi:hypothetical protein